MNLIVKKELKLHFLKAYDDNLINSIPFKHKEYVNKYVREAQKIGVELGVKVDFDGGELDERAFPKLIVLKVNTTENALSLGKECI